MLTMVINRRRFIQGVASLVLAGCARESKKPTAFFSAMSTSTATGERQHFVIGADLSAQLTFKIPCPQRAHAALALGRHAVFFSRRPGRQMYVVDLQFPDQLTVINSPEAHHFYGHGVLSLDGAHIFVSENKYKQKQSGNIAIYDSQSLARLGEIPLQGIGPHELKLMPDGKTLAVALGGIRTHPDHGRQKLNLDSMQSALLYVDVNSGKELARFMPAQQKMSIRHLDVNAAGVVLMGGQYQGALSDDTALLLRHQGQQQLQIMDINHRACRQYVASVCFDVSGHYAVMTSPRGNVAIVVDGQQQIVQQQIRDVAGACSTAPGSFCLSNGLGDLYQLGGAEHWQLSRMGATGMAWDNHLLRA